MPRYKPCDRHALMLPVVLSEEIVPGSFAFSLDLCGNCAETLKTTSGVCATEFEAVMARLARAEEALNASSR